MKRGSNNSKRKKPAKLLNQLSICLSCALSPDLYVSCVHKAKLFAPALLKSKGHACNRNRDPSCLFNTVLFPLDLVFLSHSFPAPFGQLNTNLIFVTLPWLTQGHLLPPEASFTECSRSFRPHICASFYSSFLLALWATTECVKRLTHRLSVQH